MLHARESTAWQLASPHGWEGGWLTDIPRLITKEEDHLDRSLASLVWGQWLSACNMREWNCKNPQHLSHKVLQKEWLRPWKISGEGKGVTRWLLLRVMGKGSAPGFSDGLVGGCHVLLCLQPSCLAI